MFCKDDNLEIRSSLVDNSKVRIDNLDSVKVLYQNAT